MKRLILLACWLVMAASVHSEPPVSDTGYVNYGRDGQPRYTAIRYRGKYPPKVSGLQSLDNFSSALNTAYGFLNADDYKNFLYYSDKALQTGFFTGDLYYYRSLAYSLLGKPWRARHYFRKAIRSGFCCK